MLEGRADIAVHSMKDVPVGSRRTHCLHPSVSAKTRVMPLFPTISTRWTELPQGPWSAPPACAVECQLRAARPDLVIRDLRGDVNTRLAKVGCR